MPRRATGAPSGPSRSSGRNRPLLVAIDARAAARGAHRRRGAAGPRDGAPAAAAAAGPLPGLPPPAALAHKAGHLWEQALLPAAPGARLIYCPANLAPLASRRNVVVIHDVAALRYPEWYGPVYARYQRALLPLLARRARRVITVSEFSRGEIVTGWTCPRTGGGGAERRGRALLTRRGRRGRPARLGLERPYVLAVGTRIARKNLAALAGAAARWPRRAWSS